MEERMSTDRDDSLRDSDEIEESEENEETRRRNREAEKSARKAAPNPPRTTTGRWMTAPKFGSAGSGGAELEPGPERD
jgi:hypothetical protein